VSWRQWSNRKMLRVNLRISHSHTPLGTIIKRVGRQAATAGKRSRSVPHAEEVLVLLVLKLPS